MRQNPKVCVITEEHSDGKQWKSVVVEGTYEELPDEIGHKRDRERAWSLLSKHVDWWQPGALKPVIPMVSDHSPTFSSASRSTTFREGKQPSSSCAKRSIQTVLDSRGKGLTYVVL